MENHKRNFLKDKYKINGFWYRNKFVYFNKGKIEYLSKKQLDKMLLDLEKK